MAFRSSTKRFHHFVLQEIHGPAVMRTQRTAQHVQGVHGLFVLRAQQNACHVQGMQGLADLRALQTEKSVP